MKKSREKRKAMKRLRRNGMNERERERGGTMKRDSVFFPIFFPNFCYAVNK